MRVPQSQFQYSRSSFLESSARCQSWKQKWPLKTIHCIVALPFGGRKDVLYGWCYLCVEDALRHANLLLKSNLDKSQPRNLPGFNLFQHWLRNGSKTVSRHCQYSVLDFFSWLVCQISQAEGNQVFFLCQMHCLLLLRSWRTYSWKDEWLVFNTDDKRSVQNNTLLNKQQPALTGSATDRNVKLDPTSSDCWYDQ
jgi:hypothetical protein